MENVYGAGFFLIFFYFNLEYVSLHVRRSNAAAIHLYRDTLSFGVQV
jgi:ribosomal protein S18 acetylase RimI-like enzyme